MADNYTVINSCGQIITIKSKDIGLGVEAIQSVPTDTAGTPMLVLSGSAVTSSMSAMVAAISSLSALFSVSIATSANAANVLAGSSTITSTMAGLVTVLSPNSAGIITTGTAGSPSSVFLSVQGVSSGSPIPTSMVPATSGGLTISSVIMSSGTNSTLVSSSPRQLYKIECFNNSANIGYLHTYNLSSAPTAGSSLVFDRFLVPGNATGSGLVSTTDIGVPYTTGLSYTFTGGITDADTTAVAAGAFIVNLYYK